MPSENNSNTMNHAVGLEREAAQFLMDQQIPKAFEAYKRAGLAYQEAGAHDKAAVCYASAATCWNVHSGRQPLRNAAHCSELAAREADKAKNFEYARSLYYDAAIFYEEEGDFDKYSECYFKNKCADRRHLWHALTHEESSFKERVESFWKWLLNVVGDLIWGYGEKPIRPFLAGLTVVLVMALIYHFSGLVNHNGHPLSTAAFGDSLYLSAVTFTTVGFGDFVPTGWVRIFASLEALCGIVLAPMFIVSLSRRYLRINR